MTYAAIERERLELGWLRVVAGECGIFYEDVRYQRVPAPADDATIAPWAFQGLLKNRNGNVSSRFLTANEIEDIQHDADAWKAYGIGYDRAARIRSLPPIHAQKDAS